jgi:hypothetical protein
MTTITINDLPKSCALTKIELCGDHETIIELVRSVTTYPTIKNKSGNLELDASKKDIAGVYNAVFAHNDRVKKSESKPSTTQTTEKPAERYVELLATAEFENLNHGRAWYCSELDIETKGASPAWEGEQICYVYPN